METTKENFMRILNKSACSETSFAGNHIQADTNRTKTNFKGNIGLIQEKFGNGCGHDPKNPKKFIQSIYHKARFPFLEEGKKRMSSAFSCPFQYDIYGNISYHEDKKTKKGIKRKIRSEKRAALTQQVGQVILHYVNIEHMAVGMIEKGEFKPFGIHFIQKVSGCSYHQTHNSLKTLEDLGYIEIEQKKYVNEIGEFKSSPAIIHVKKSLFAALELTQEFNDFVKTKDAARFRAALQGKATAYNEVKRSNHKHAKEQLKKMRAAINETPGSERRRQSTPLYADLTGLTRKEAMRQQRAQFDQDAPRQALEYLRLKLQKNKDSPS